MWAVVPVKDFAAAKRRLAAALTPEQRPALCTAMLEDVLAALDGVRALAGIVLVTSEPRAAAIAEQRGAYALPDERRGLNGAVATAVRWLQGRAVRDMLVLPGDVPLATSADIERVIAAHGPSPAVTLVPARDGRGTNGALCSPPEVLPLCYGEDSFRAHLRAARGAGIEANVLRSSNLGLDIDWPGDLEAFLRLPSGTRTYAYLCEQWSGVT